MDPTCGLAEKFRDLMLEQIWEQFRYLVCYGQNIEQLTTQLVKLTLRREAIQRRIDKARNDVKQIEGEVLHWVDEVDTIFKQVEQLHKESQAKRGCSITSCSNPWLRYKLSKSTKEMVQKVQKVSDIYEKGMFARVSYDVPPRPQPELTDEESNEGIESRVLIMNQTMEALRSQNINMIGLCGPGGVGKTTITKEVEKNQNKFEKVITATVSDELNIEKIQGQIAKKLGMQLNEKDEDARANRLRERLKQEENMLLILDDLWKKLDLGKAGISVVEGCKIFITSRDKTVLSKGMQCQKIIDVDVLSEDEALALFKRIAKFSFDSSNPDLISTATKIVQSCGGLPLAIATAAKAFDEKDPNGCKDYLARLKNHLRRNVTGIKEVDASLKSSYSRLSRENQNIFLLSAMLFHDPSIEDLLKYSVGLIFLMA